MDNGTIFHEMGLFRADGNQEGGVSQEELRLSTLTRPCLESPRHLGSDNVSTAVVGLLVFLPHSYNRGSSCEKARADETLLERKLYFHVWSLDLAFGEKSDGKSSS